MEVDDQGRNVYTQVSNSGGQFPSPTCIYKVKVTSNDEALSYVEGIDMGTFSITLFDDTEGLAADEVTARLCGIELCYAGELSDTVNTEELAQAVNEAEALDSTKYTEDSFAAVTASSGSS